MNQESLIGALRNGGLATSGSNTTLSDTTKSWIVNDPTFVGTKVLIIHAGIEYSTVISSNTATQLTFTALSGGVLVAAGDAYFFPFDSATLVNVLAVLAAIAALNNLSSAQAQSACGSAIEADAKVAVLVARNVVPYPLPSLSSSYQQIVLTAGAGNKSCPSIAIPANFIPTGATVAHAYLALKFSGRENTSASINSISGAQSIQAKKATGGAFTNAIDFTGGEYSTAIGALISGDTEGEGDVIFGQDDIKLQCPANGDSLTIQWTSGVAAFANLNFDDCQFILTIWVTVP